MYTSYREETFADKIYRWYKQKLWNEDMVRAAFDNGSINEYDLNRILN